jgi:hypothetical protein
MTTPNGVPIQNKITIIYAQGGNSKWRRRCPTLGEGSCIRSLQQKQEEMLKLLYFISDSPEEAHLHQFN